MALKLIDVDEQLYSYRFSCNACTKTIARGRKVVEVRSRAINGANATAYIHDTCFMKFSDEVVKEVGRPVSPEQYQRSVSALEAISG